MDALIFNRLQQVQAEQDEARRAELMAESGPDIGAHFRRNLDDLEELAFDLLNVSWADGQTDDPVRLIIESKTVGLGAIDEYDEDLRGMHAYWQGKGGQIRSGLIRYEKQQMPREEMVAAIDLHQDELELDFWGQFAKLTTQAQDKIRLLPTEKLVELIQAIGSSYSTYGTFAKATLSDTQFDGVLDEVADNTDGEVTIVGTRTAVRALNNIGLDYGDNIKEQIFRTGQIGVYKGYRVVQIANSENFAGAKRLPNDELWLVGSKAGRITYYGATAKVQQLRQPSFMLRWETARDAGMLLFGANKGRIGRVVLT